MHTTHDTHEPILFSTLPMQNGQSIGCIRLNAERKLNALSRIMVERMYAQLEAWKHQANIAAIWLDAAGDKAFCSGGDLQDVHQYMQSIEQLQSDAGQQKLQEASRFFAEEYQFNYYMHRYPKPLIAWGHGIIMGGGMGLYMGSSHRIATEKSRMAMPEISVGLFPDVGGSWFLHQCPGCSGLFLGLTGSQLQAYDALFTGWAQHYILSSQKSDVLAALCAITSPLDDSTAHAEVTRVLQRLQSQPTETQGLRYFYDTIQAVCAQPTLEEVVHSILALKNDAPFIQQAQANLAYGAPSTARITYRLYHEAKFLSLYDIFKLEHTVAIHCLQHGDFVEGIRALLIDKDRQPRWNPPQIASATHAWAEKFFVPLGEGFPFIAFAPLAVEK